MSAQQQKAQEQEKKRQEMRQQILQTYMSSEARDRLGTIRLVKPEKVAQVEDIIVAMVQQHKLNGIVDDPMLLDLLEKVSASEQTGNIKIIHRGRDDEWDDDDEGW